MSYHQVSLFEWQNGGAPFDPLETVAKSASPAHVGDRELLANMMEAGTTLAELTNAARQAYCPCGAAGHYGSTDEPATVYEWDMNAAYIRIRYNDEDGWPREDRFTWQAFARALLELYGRGDYVPDKL